MQIRSHLASLSIQEGSDRCSMLTESDTQGRILHTQGLEAQTRNRTSVTNTFFRLPTRMLSVPWSLVPIAIGLTQHLDEVSKTRTQHIMTEGRTSGQIDLLSKSQLGHKCNSLFICACPFTSTSSPRRRIVGRRGLVELGASYCIRHFGARVISTRELRSCQLTVV